MEYTVDGKKLIIHEGCEEIGYRDLCEVLAEEEIEEIFLPETIRVIHNDAFFDWPEITAINIPAGTQHIGAQAFWGLDELKEITLPVSVSFVGKHAFCNCGNLTITIAGGAGEIPGGWDPAFAANIKQIRFSEN